MIDVRERARRQRRRAAWRCPRSRSHLYGCAAVESVPTSDGSVVRVTGLVEKPTPPRRRATWPSSAATCSTRRSSTSCATTAPGRGGEIQLTDALQELAGDRTTGGGVYGVVFRGRRYDTGDRLRLPQGRRPPGREHREDLGPDFAQLARRTTSPGRTEPTRRESRSSEHLDAPCGTCPAARPASTSPCSTPRAASWPRTSWPRRDLPGFDNSAMDGYAVRAADVAGATRRPGRAAGRRRRRRRATTARCGSRPGRPCGS